MAALDLSAELLEEMLKRAEVEFFPKLRRYIENFVDVFNYDLTQTELIVWIKETERVAKIEMEKRIIAVNGDLQKVNDASTVYDMLRLLRFAIESLVQAMGEGFKTVVTLQTGSLISNLLQNGFHSLLLHQELKFLEDDELSMDDRSVKLITYIKETSKETSLLSDSTQAFTEYIESWRQRKSSQNWSDEQIRLGIASMKKDYQQASKNNIKSMNKIIEAISTRFEPLREKLVQVRQTRDGVVAGTGTVALGAVGLLAAGINPIAAIAVGIAAVVGGTGTTVVIDKVGRRRLERGWFDNTKRWLQDYINGLQSDNELLFFIMQEDLEKDVEHFQNALSPWIRERIEKNRQLRNGIPTWKHERCILPKQAVLLELNRMSKFMYAVVLNKPQMLEEHKDMLMDVMNEVACAPEPTGLECLIPCISFGQLPLAGGDRARVIQLKFVLSQSITDVEIRNVVDTLKRLFENYHKCEMAVENGLSVVNLKVTVDENITSFIGSSISNFADLSIRGVLVGNFGVNIASSEASSGFRHAMNPTFNRIYSVNAQDKEEGFEATYFPGSFDRGGEPYFCPNGWRRYAIDVGMTGSEFQRAYGSWPVAYHGTEGHRAMHILLSGLQANRDAIKGTGKYGVFLSPSIEYSGHPRYARVWQAKNKYVQMVLQVRVARNLIYEKNPGTVDGSKDGDPPLDTNFSSNMQMEWVVRWPPGAKMTAHDGIIIYGLMLRVTDQHPKDLPHNKWWGPDWEKYIM